MEMNCCSTMESEDKVHDEGKSLEASIPRLPLDVGNDEDEEPEEWEQDEEPEEWKLEDESEACEPEEEPEEWTVEDSEEKLQESVIEEAEEPEEWPAEEPVKSPKEELQEWSVEEPTEASKFSWPKSATISSNEKKRSRDATPDESAILPVGQAQKKHRQEESPKLTSNVSSGYANSQSEAGVLEKKVDENDSELGESTGSSGKRRRAVVEDDTSCKKRKTKWDDDAQLKILGPVQLPDFKKGLAFGSDLELEIIELKANLIAVNCKLQRSELQDDRPENERSPSPEPVYNYLGIRTNTRESRIRMKLIEERQCIISKLIQKNPTFKPPSEEMLSKLSKKLYISVEEYPGYNFVGPIIGPRGNTQRRMQKETGAKIQVRGRGASRIQLEPVNSSTEDLHVYIEADNQKSLDAAVAMVEKLLIPYCDGVNEHKKAQFAELAQLNRKDGGKVLCKVCGKEGHEHFTCPSAFTTPTPLKTCGGNSHPTACCPTEAPSTLSNSLPDSLGHGLGSTPIAQCKPEANLYVANLPQALDDNWLKDLFSPYGKIISVRVIKDRTTGFGKGYGFVQFENTDDAAMAVMHMNGYKLYGKILSVRVAEHPSVSIASTPSLFPAYPCPTAVCPDFHSQAWFYPPQAYYYPDTTGVDFSSSLVYPDHGQHLPNGEAVGQPLPDISTVSNYESSLHYSSYGSPSRFPYASPALFPQIPSFSDYYSFQYQFPSTVLHLNQSLESEVELAPCPATDLQYDDPSLYTSWSNGSQDKSCLATTVSETSSALHPNQLLESEPKLTPSPAADLHQQDPSLQTSQSLNPKPAPLFHLEAPLLFENGLKTVSSFDADDLQQELPLELEMSSESECKPIFCLPTWVLLNQQKLNFRNPEGTLGSCSDN